jgi:site-specific DNA-methyltransferase (adenine-specific)
MEADWRGFLNKVICGDALNVLKRIPSNSIQMAITSPPYNLGVNYDAYSDDLEYDQYLKWLKDIWTETKRVLVDGGRLAVNIAPTSIKNFRPVHHDISKDLRDSGMIFRAEIIWYKQSMTARRTAWGSWRSPSNPHIIPSWEYVMVFSKKQWRLEGKKENVDIKPEEFEKYSDGFWLIPPDNDSFWHIPPERVRNGHPAPFPEELISRLVKFYTYKGDILLDMFGGTGTVAAVAMKLERQFVYIDISKEYCEVALKRLTDYCKPQTTLVACRRIEPELMMVEA